MHTHDAIVIGSGQSGPFLAVRLANAGLKTALIEREHLGGTCVNDGCIPTKTLVASARAAHVARRAADFGVIVDGAVGAPLLEALIDAVRVALGSYSWQGIMRPQIIPGAIGRDAKVIGAAYLPLHANFAPGVESFLKPRQ